MKHYLSVMSLLLLSILVGCRGRDGNDLSKGKDFRQREIQIVTTTGMIADAAKNVGGSRVQVTPLMGPGVDPHLYKASEGDVSRLSKADIILYNGLHLEGKMAEIFEQMQRMVITIAIGEAIEKDQLLSPPEFQGAYDPHIWFDVEMWIEVVKFISTKLVALDSVNAHIYTINTENYLQKLSELDEYVLKRSQEVVDNKRVLITAHDAFNYFGWAYGFEVKGLQGISTAAEAGTADVQKLAEFIVERKIPAIFVETSVPPRYIEALQAAVNSRGYKVKIGGTLFSDAMGNPGTLAGTYIGMVKHNIDTIVNALLE